MPSARSVLRDYGLSPKKSWGQNFLIDGAALARIERACELDDEDGTVVEFGAGTGALTDRLISGDRKVLAIEYDRDLVALLKDRYADRPQVTIIDRDIRKVDLAEIAREAGVKIKVVGNLPYQISAPILFRLVEQRKHIRSAHVLLQDEVARRIIARPGSKNYSLLSVILGRVAKVESAAVVGRNCFFPAPKVDSRFIVIRPTRKEPDSPSDGIFASFVQAAFHQRRKKLINSLRTQSFLPMGANLLDAIRQSFSEQSLKRAETLDVNEFVQMAAFVESQLKQPDKT